MWLNPHNYERIYVCIKEYSLENIKSEAEHPTSNVNTKHYSHAHKQLIAHQKHTGTYLIFKSNKINYSVQAGKSTSVMGVALQRAASPRAKST